MYKNFRDGAGAMKKKILLFSRDPGGANVIMPLFELLKDKGYSVGLFGKDMALYKYEEMNLPALNIMEFISNVSIENIEKFIINEKPDFIITGTSADDGTEKYIWKSARKLSIPSFAVLDQWVNYGIRFSPYSLSEISLYNKNRVHTFLPEKILVMDNYAKEEGIKEGLPPSGLVVTGQPYFETLIKNSKKINSDKIKKIKRKFEISEKDFFITYASEDLSKTYKETDNSCHYWGYTERTIFRNLVKAIEKISHKYNKNIKTVIKIHPKEDINNYFDIIKKYNKLNIIADKNSKPHDLILSSDLICGMSSMFLIESVISGKPTLSIQIGLKRKNPFILDRRNILKSILNEDDLFRSLKSVIVENKIPEYKFEIIKNATNNIIREMEIYI